MHFLLERQILGGGQRHARRRDTFHGGVVGQIGEEYRSVNGTRAAELAHEKFRFLERDTDSREHHREVRALVAQHFRLTGNLRGKVGMREAGAGENRQFLPANQRVQAVDSGDARLNKFVGVVAGGGVHGEAVNVAVLLREDVGAAVDRLSHAVEHAPEHVAGYAQFQRVSQKADFRVCQIDSGGTLEKLYYGRVAVDFQHLSAPDGTVVQFDFHQFVIGDVLDHANHHQRADDFFYSFVFPNHAFSPPSAAISSICCAISARIWA